jgi:hypothetical protein
MMMFNKKLLLIFLSSIFFTNLYSFNNIEYEIQIQPQKQQQINKAVLLKQYLYDLKKLNEILWLLYSDKSFRYVSHTAELEIKNSKSYYTTEYIKNLIRVLDGVDPYNDFNILNKGYMKYIEDIYNDNYKMYLTNYPAVITKNFDVIENTIKENLVLLNKQYKAQKNVKPALRNIFNELLIALSEVYEETAKLVNLKVIKPFDKRIDYKYKMPNNWAQYNTTLAGMLNFIINGSEKYNYLGIKDYYNQVYKDDTQGLIINY